MLDKNQILQRLKIELAELSREFGVKRIGLFGSFANNTQTSQSDIDLIVDILDANSKSACLT